MKIGNTSFNPKGVKEMGLRKFKTRYKGVIKMDLKEAYKLICDELKK